MAFLPDVITHSSHSAAMSTIIKLARVPTRDVEVLSKYTVVDVGIEAGEVLGDILGFEITADGQIIFESDSVTDLTEILRVKRGDQATGQILDSMPTTNTAHYAYHVIPLNHDLSMYKNVTLKIELAAPNTEWAAASSFELETRVNQTPGIPGQSDAVIKYTAADSAKEHKFDVKPWMDLQEVHGVISTGELQQVSVFDDRTLSGPIDYKEVSETRKLSMDYYRRTFAAATSGTFTTWLLTSIGFRTSGKTTSRTLRIYASAAGTVTRLFMYGQAQRSFM